MLVTHPPEDRGEHLRQDRPRARDAERTRLVAGGLGELVDGLERADPVTANPLASGRQAERVAAPLEERRPEVRRERLDPAPEHAEIDRELPGRARERGAPALLDEARQDDEGAEVLEEIARVHAG